MGFVEDVGTPLIHQTPDGWWEWRCDVCKSRSRFTWPERERAWRGAYAHLVAAEVHGLGLISKGAKNHG